MVVNAFHRSVTKSVMDEISRFEDLFIGTLFNSVVIAEQREREGERGRERGRKREKEKERKKARTSTTGSSEMPTRSSMSSRSDLLSRTGVRSGASRPRK